MTRKNNYVTVSVDDSTFSEIRNKSSTHKEKLSRVSGSSLREEDSSMTDFNDDNGVQDGFQVTFKDSGRNSKARNSQEGKHGNHQTLLMYRQPKPTISVQSLHSENDIVSLASAHDDEK